MKTINSTIGLFLLLICLLCATSCDKKEKEPKHICLTERSETKRGITCTLSCDSILTISGKGEINTTNSWGYDRFLWDLWWKKEITSVVINDGITSIGEYTFSNCYYLKSVAIPNSVTSIGRGAFSGCSYLKSVTIPNSVTYIGEWAFSSCYSLTSIIIPNSVIYIGSWVFDGCSSLTSITIPNSVTFLGIYIFAYCTVLTEIINESVIPQNISVETFGTKPIYTLRVPAASVDAYRAAEVWKYFGNIVAI